MYVFTFGDDAIIASDFVLVIVYFLRLRVNVYKCTSTMVRYSSGSSHNEFEICNKINFKNDLSVPLMFRQLDAILVCEDQN